MLWLRLHSGKENSLISQSFGMIKLIKSDSIGYKRVHDFFLKDIKSSLALNIRVELSTTVNRVIRLGTIKDPSWTDKWVLRCLT